MNIVPLLNNSPNSACRLRLEAKLSLFSANANLMCVCVCVFEAIPMSKVRSAEERFFVLIIRSRVRGKSQLPSYLGGVGAVAGVIICVVCWNTKTFGIFIAYIIGRLYTYSIGLVVWYVGGWWCRMCSKARARLFVRFLLEVATAAFCLVPRSPLRWCRPFLIVSRPCVAHTTYA